MDEGAVVGSVGPHGREFSDAGMIVGEVAYRIGCGVVAGEREGLAAAAAEIKLAGSSPSATSG